MRLIYSEGGLRMPSAIFCKGYKSVFAGSDCLIAITSAGKLLQKTWGSAVSLNEYAYNGMDLSKIAVSNACPGMTMALDSDGYCRIERNGISRYCTSSECRLRVLQAAAQWKGITDIAVSDAFFGLDTAGRVHVAALSDRGQTEYASAEKWENVTRIAVGLQNAIFGVTRDGRVLCAGANCLNGPHGDISGILAGLNGVAAIGAMGSECEEILVFFRDGRVKGLFSDIDDIIPAGGIEVSSNAGCVAAKDGRGRLHFYCRNRDNEERFDELKGRMVENFALGDIDFINPFAAALI